MTYRITRADGSRTKKKTVPDAIPEHARQISEDGVVTQELIDWAQRALLEMRKKNGGQRKDPERTNHVQLGYVFERVREGEWFKNQLSTKWRQEVELPMRWVESQLGSDFWLATWDDDTLHRLRRAPEKKGVKTEDGDPFTCRRAAEILRRRISRI